MERGIISLNLVVQKLLVYGHLFYVVYTMNNIIYQCGKNTVIIINNNYDKFKNAQY